MDEKNQNIQIKSGIIKKIEKEKLLVELAPIVREECGDSCNCKGLVLEDKPKGIQVWIPNNSSKKFQLGETVFVQANLPAAYLSILFIFVLPIILLIAGAVMGDYFVKVYQLTKPNLWIAGSALLGFALAIIFALIFDTLYRRWHSVFELWDGKGNLQQLLETSSPCSSCTSDCHLAKKAKK